MNRSDRLEMLSTYLDGELSEADRRWLAAWAEGHTEDRECFEELAEVVRLVREVPEAEPPAGLRARILRACAEAVPVEVPREQAAEWLDKYFDGELAAPQALVVEHYMAVDPDFAETAAVHQRMLDMLRDVEEVEPPRDLRRRIEADVERLERGVMPARRGGRRTPARVGLLRQPAFALAACAVLVLGGLAALRGNRQEPAPRLAAEPDQPFVTPDEVDDPVRIEPLPDTSLDHAPVTVEELGAPAPAVEDEQPVIERDMPAEPRHVAPITPRPPVGSIASGTREPAKPAVPPQPLAPKASPDMAPAPLPGVGPGGALAGGDDRTVPSPETGGSAQDGNQTPGADRQDSRGAVDPTRSAEVPPF